jgi:hypothetical protein
MFVKTQNNGTLASMQRTSNPTYHRYYGNGTGRDHQILEYDGGLTSAPKLGLGNTGVHVQRYNGTVTRRISPQPGYKDA